MDEARVFARRWLASGKVRAFEHPVSNIYSVGGRYVMKQLTPVAHEQTQLVQELLSQAGVPRELLGWSYDVGPLDPNWVFPLTLNLTLLEPVEVERLFALFEEPPRLRLDQITRTFFVPRIEQEAGSTWWELESPPASVRLVNLILLYLERGQLFPVRRLGTTGAFMPPDRHPQIAPAFTQPWQVVTAPKKMRLWWSPSVSALGRRGGYFPRLRDRELQRDYGQVVAYDWVHNGERMPFIELYHAYRAGQISERDRVHPYCYPLPKTIDQWPELKRVFQHLTDYGSPSKKPPRVYIYASPHPMTVCRRIEGMQIYSKEWDWEPVQPDEDSLFAADQTQILGFTDLHGSNIGVVPQGDFHRLTIFDFDRSFGRRKMVRRGVVPYRHAALMRANPLYPRALIERIKSYHNEVGKIRAWLMRQDQIMLSIPVLRRLQILLQEEQFTLTYHRRSIVTVEATAEGVVRPYFAHVMAGRFEDELWRQLDMTESTFKERYDLAYALFPRATLPQIQAWEEREQRGYTYLTNHEELSAGRLAPLAFVNAPSTPLSQAARSQWRQQIEQDGQEEVREMLVQATRPSFCNMVAARFPLAADFWWVGSVVWGEEVYELTGDHLHPIRDLLARFTPNEDPSYLALKGAISEVVSA